LPGTGGLRAGSKARWWEHAQLSRAACEERPLPAELGFSSGAPFCAAGVLWKTPVFRKKTSQ